jgi:hypothetical protein
MVSAPARNRSADEEMAFIDATCAESWLTIEEGCKILHEVAHINNKPSSSLKKK